MSVCVLNIAPFESHSPLESAVITGVKYNVMYISFVDEYAVQFNTEDFYCGSLIIKKFEQYCTKFGILFLLFHFIHSPGCFES